MKRIARLLILFGVIVILLSNITGAKVGDMNVIKDNEPYLLLFETAQDVYVNITLDEHSNGTFDVYFLSWQNANQTMVLNQTYAPISPLASFENVSSLIRVVHVPSPGSYVLLFTTNSSQLQIIWIEILFQGMNSTAASGGALLIGIGVTLLAIHEIRVRKYS